VIIYDRFVCRGLVLDAVDGKFSTHLSQFQRWGSLFTAKSQTKVHKYSSTNGYLLSKTEYAFTKISDDDISTRLFVDMRWFWDSGKHVLSIFRKTFLLVDKVELNFKKTWKVWEGIWTDFGLYEEGERGDGGRNDGRTLPKIERLLVSKESGGKGLDFY
jgi:hypothetical protein